MPQSTTLTVRQQQPWHESPWTPSKSPTGLHYHVPKPIPEPFVRMGWQPKTRVPRLQNCREVIKPSQSSTVPTPSIWVHTPRCRCAQDKLDRERQDEALANTITTLSTTYRARLKLEAEISISLPKSKKVPHKRSRSSVLITRLLSSLSPSNLGGKQSHHPNIISIQHLADLCNGCSELDAPKVITYLHDHKIPVNTPNHLGLTPLICALRSPLAKSLPRSHLAFLKFLLESGANPNLPSTGPSDPSTPLSVACSLHSLPSEHIEAILKLLLDKGAAVDLPIPSLGSSGGGGKINRQTALHIATLCSNPIALSSLLGYGNANPNPSSLLGTNGLSVSPLHLAAHTDTVCAGVLLKHGADPLARDQQGKTPLHWAAEYGYDVGLVELLMGYMKDDEKKVEVVWDVLRRVVKHLENGHGRRGHVAVVRALLLQGGGSKGTRRVSRSIRERLERLDEEWGWGPVFEAMIQECLSPAALTRNNSLSSGLSGETAVDEKKGEQVVAVREECDVLTPN
ncbi:ankyrin repeat-containing domain protein [Apiosordaria backusii]|uniref:Ankyrin repeat-containing domain protein n=1 Tax=Apiosordaria backusii TaxID=314023 RepID=A0AA40K3D5_9PEZI|nr:ankyrin repeat-containing domain protein [Apiosordaria backusii]